MCGVWYIVFDVVFVNDADIAMCVNWGLNDLNDPPPRVETRPGILNNPR